jgi:hypothetical protein
MKKNLTAISFGFVLMVIVMRMQGMALKPFTILDLEFAGNSTRVQELFAHWQRGDVKMNTWLDFLFIISYVLFFSFAAEAAALKWPEKSGGRQLGLFLAKVAYAAGIFDVVENLLMLQTTDGNYTGFSLQLTYSCAAIKFTLIGILILYFIFSLRVIIKNK